MSKRSHFEKIAKDKYRTPYEVVIPLLSQLPAGSVFAEPCAGNGVLIDHLVTAGHQCVWASDIEPERDDVKFADALNLSEIRADMVITNPPWTRSILHPLIDHLSSMLPTWLLFDADWGFTAQSSELIRRCSKIVPIGRVKWIPDSKYSGMDSCAWYEFLPGHTIGPRLVPRQIASGGRTVAPVARAALQPPTAGNAPPPTLGPSTSSLLAKLRVGMRPMNVPRLSTDNLK